MKATPESIAAYVSGKTDCPVCGQCPVDGPGVEGRDSPDVRGSMVYQEVACLACGAVWTDEYSLSGASFIQKGGQDG